jgi:hypothetical protein
MEIQHYPTELNYVNAWLALRGLDDRSFLGLFLQACLHADTENYEFMRPALLLMMEKYPAPAKQLAAEQSND